MNSPQEMKRLIMEVNEKGFSHYFSKYFDSHKTDYMKIFGNANEKYEEYTEGLLEMYSQAAFIKNNIQIIPQHIVVEETECDMTGEQNVTVSRIKNFDSKKILFYKTRYDYIVEYKTRTFGVDDKVESAIEDMMLYYTENKVKDNELLNLFAIVYYYCSEIVVYEPSKNYQCRELNEVAVFSEMEEDIFKRMGQKVQFDEDDIRSQDCRNPKNLFTFFKNNNKLNDIELEYLKEFNIALKMLVIIKYYDSSKIARRSTIAYSKERHGFVHRTKDEDYNMSYNSSTRSNIDEKTYLNSCDVNELIELMKNHDIIDIRLAVSHENDTKLNSKNIY